MRGHMNVENKAGLGVASEQLSSKRRVISGIHVVLLRMVEKKMTLTKR
jgi:hypothetical protein